MPVIKTEKVISFSSEDPLHTANNVLSSDPSKKWKCQSPGEKSASVVLQLEKASVISSIDIGNESSAYIEVLVSRSSAQDDFKVLLVMSSFMTPLEARQGINLNKVRMFNREELSKPECDEKWDRVKIVCTQPFNRHVQYGISFITLHSLGEKDSSITASSIAKFIVRPDSPDNLSAGSLFARRKELQQENTTLKAAAAIRQASSLALESQTKTPPSKKTSKFYSSWLDDDDDDEKNVIKKRNRNELLYTKDEEEPNKKIDYVVEQKKKEKEEKTNTPNKKTEKKEAKTKAVTPNIRPSTSATDSNKRKLSDASNMPIKKLKPGKLCKPFGKLLEGVVFVISGIQNPDRASLRDKALSMGARYKADWDSSCTHLICAFPNTPKFNQVRGKGKIVTKNWIIDCASKRKRLPWRRYALDRNDKGKDESEEEICEFIEEKSKADVDANPTASTSKFTPVRSKTPPKNKAESDSISQNPKPSSSTAQKINGTTRNSDTEDDEREMKQSGTDTDDEIERIQKLQTKKVTHNRLSDIFNFDTDEEDTIRTHSKNGNPSLPDFFTGKTFYIDPNLSKQDKALLVKYITAFNGVIKENLNGFVDLIVSSAELKSALSSSSKADIVPPDYIWECHNSETLIPVDNFKL